MTTVSRSDNEKAGKIHWLYYRSHAVKLITIFQILLIISQLQRGPPGAIHFALYSGTILTASQSASHREEVKKMRIFLTHGSSHRTLGLHPGINIWNPDVRKTSFRRFAQVGKNVHHNNTEEIGERQQDVTKTSIKRYYISSIFW